jgi:hypothetical protein
MGRDTARSGGMGDVYEVMVGNLKLHEISRRKWEGNIKTGIKWTW